MNTLKDMAKRNYGRTWTIEMLETLVKRGKLSASDFEEITGLSYTTNVEPINEPTE